MLKLATFYTPKTYMLELFKNVNKYMSDATFIEFDMSAATILAQNTI